MIIEGLLTTTRADGSPHVAPMGPVVSPELDKWTLRPFQSSTTFTNLREQPAAIFHVVDDVLPVVQAAFGRPHGLQFDPHRCGGWIIESCCRWFRLEVTKWDITALRSEAIAALHSQGECKPFWGWNRAKHAVLEATILLTRRHMIDDAEIATQLDALQPAVEKTAGPRELAAWQLLIDVLQEPA